MLTEVCDEFAAIGEPVKEEDHVVYLLASLPECLIQCPSNCP